MMTIEQLPKAAIGPAVDRFKKAYAQAHRAAEQLSEHVHGGVCVPDEFGSDDAKEVVRLLTEALCSARALDNLLAGNPPPKKGE